jgi:O-antigen ligase
VGIGNFIYQAARFLPFSKTVHSAFLQIFSELGFPGLLIVIAVLGRNIKLIWSMMKSDDEDRAGLGKFLLVQLVAVAVSAMFIPVAYEYIFWIWLVLPSLAHQVYSRRAGEPLRT